MNDNLAKMGSARVSLVDFAGKKCIEKLNVSPVEYQFYHGASAALKAAGVHTPDLITSRESNHSLLLEFIPLSVTQEELVADQGVIKMLACLHHQPGHSNYIFRQHTWSEHAGEQAIRLLGFSGAPARLLVKLQKMSHELFLPKALISGDSNAGNWGRRSNGELVLFDWERFGQGSPAIDLAPLIKGMGQWEEYRSIAERYTGLHPAFSTQELAREIAISKAWIVTEVVDILQRRSNPALGLYLNWYRNVLPLWLESLGKSLYHLSPG